MLSAPLRRTMLPSGTKAEIKRPLPKTRRASVSVVIPCYNYGRYLPQCVRSVTDQQDVNADVLIIDDASSDDSAAIAANLAAQDSRIRTIRHATNQGHIKTYNEGLNQAAGDYAVLLSADDLLTPGCLSRAASLMDAYPSVGLTYGFPVDFASHEPPRARTIATNWIIWQGRNWLGHLCKTGRNLLRSPEAVMRTSVLHELGGYSADLPHAADLEMWMRAATVSDVGYIGGADQAYYRIHNDNMHHSDFDIILQDVSQRLRVFDKICDNYGGMLTDAAMMHSAAHRALAREALAHAISAYARGVADTQPIEDYMAFALDAWPDSSRLREWRELCRLRTIPESKLRRDPWLIAGEARRALTFSIRWRRRRWVGVD
jgi:hypothetical protein